MYQIGFQVLNGFRVINIENEIGIVSLWCFCHLNGTRIKYDRLLFYSGHAYFSTFCDQLRSFSFYSGQAYFSTYPWGKVYLPDGPFSNNEKLRSITITYDHFLSTVVKLISLLIHKEKYIYLMGRSLITSNCDQLRSLTIIFFPQ